MTALILVVDDLEPNVKLLEAKLSAEYYDVVTASDGVQAIEQAKKHMPDIILLDVMMPNMDGFEACKILKETQETAHIPVVMVTALSEPSDRIRGLQCGADDFLTKPINDVQLMARVRSLVRIKQLIDELRMRGQTSTEIGEVTGFNMNELKDVSGARILLVDDDVVESSNIMEQLKQEKIEAWVAETDEEAMQKAVEHDVDLVIVSTQLINMDGLRLCSHFRSSEKTRHIPQLIMVDVSDERALVKGLDMGVNDYIMSPVDVSELICRVRTNVRRKKYQDSLRSSYKQTVKMAIKDNLTGLYNRHYMDAHVKTLAASALERGKPLSCLMMDMDHFKSVNDTYGHDVGDEILKELANRIIEQTRGSDMVARYGGEEFTVMLPGAPVDVATEVAERIRQSVESVPFKISHEQGTLSKTISVGCSTLDVSGGPNAPLQERIDMLLKHADEALYEAKHGGRNRVVIYNANTGSGAANAPASSPQPVANPEGPASVSGAVADSPSAAQLSAPQGAMPQAASPQSAPVMPTSPVEQSPAAQPQPAPVESSTPASAGAAASDAKSTFGSVDIPIPEEGLSLGGLDEGISSNAPKNSSSQSSSVTFGRPLEMSKSSESSSPPAPQQPVMSQAPQTPPTPAPAVTSPQSGITQTAAPAPSQPPQQPTPLPSASTDRPLIGQPAPGQASQPIPSEPGSSALPSASPATSQGNERPLLNPQAAPPAVPLATSAPLSKPVSTEPLASAPPQPTQTPAPPAPTPHATDAPAQAGNPAGNNVSTPAPSGGGAVIQSAPPPEIPPEKQRPLNAPAPSHDSGEEGRAEDESEDDSPFGFAKRLFGKK